MKKYMCLICGHIYDEAFGDPDTGIAPGTKWEDVPPNWTCPDCGARKEDYEVARILEECPRENPAHHAARRRPRACARLLHRRARHEAVAPADYAGAAASRSRSSATATNRRTAVLELTYNWDTSSYDIGGGFGHVAIEVPTTPRQRVRRSAPRAATSRATRVRSRAVRRSSLSYRTLTATRSNSSRASTPPDAPHPLHGLRAPVS